ncbi:MAG: peptidase M1, partial [Bryobacteraceae bacterium]|nr:peptidase M1 [Bryobacteraceae bacterium]
MYRKVWTSTAIAAAFLAGGTAAAQEKRTAIDAGHYVITAEINPASQTISAQVQVRFAPLENTSSVAFELNNALNVARIVDGAGRQIPASRSQTDSTVRLTFPDTVAKGTSSSLTFTYDGRLTGAEESPVYGIKFASIQKDHAFLLYPARWFPVTEYSVDRFTADLQITVPDGYRVIASGVEEPATRSGDKLTYKFSSKQPSFPGSIAVVQGDPVRTSSQGVNSSIYFREGKDMAGAYGEETG